MIKGQKVIIRPVEKKDLEFVKELYNDEKIALFEGRWEFPLTITQQEKWFESNFDNPHSKHFVILDSKTSELVGYTSLNEINWQNRMAHTAVKLHPKAGGKGYAYDAVMTLMSYVFYQMGLNKLKGMIVEYNTASYHLYVEKCGWRVEGLFRQHVYQHGCYYDVYPVSILKKDFLQIAKGTTYERDDLVSLYGKIKLKDEHVKFKYK